MQYVRWFALANDQSRVRKVSDPLRVWEESDEWARFLTLNRDGSAGSGPSISLLLVARSHFRRRRQPEADRQDFKTRACSKEKKKKKKETDHPLRPSANELTVLNGRPPEDVRFLFNDRSRPAFVTFVFNSVDARGRVEATHRDLSKRNKSKTWKIGTHHRAP